MYEILKPNKRELRRDLNSRIFPSMHEYISDISKVNVIYDEDFSFNILKKYNANSTNKKHDVKLFLLI